MRRPGQIQDTSAQDQALDTATTPRQRLQRWLLPAAIVLVALAVLAWTVSAWSGGGRSHDGARIRVAEVVRGDLVRDIAADGRVISANSPTLYAIAGGTVSQIRPQLAELSPDELRRLRDIEAAGRNRSTLLAAIDRALAER